MEAGSFKLNGMRLPQSISQPFSTRVFIILIITVAQFALPLWAGASKQQLTCAPCSVRFGTVPIGQTETEIVVLTNGGSTSVTVSAANLGGTGFSLSNLTLPLVIPAGQSVSLNVTFSPTATGWTGGKGTITSNAANPQLTLELGGSGTTSDSLVASPASVSFGQVAVGSSSTVPVVLSNTRSWSVKITSWQATGSGFSVSGPALPLTLTGGQTVTLNLTFTPQTTGTSGGSVFVSGPSLNVPLAGTGTTTTAGQLTITPSLVNFGNVTVGTTGIQPITMSAANASVTVTSDASSSSQFVLSGASLPLTIPAGQSMSFNVAFTPTGSGTVSGSLSFISNASNSQTSESLTGTGTLKQYSVNLYWNASTDVVGYNVYRSTSSDGSYAKINSSLDPNTAYTDTSVGSGTTYYYEATAVNSSGQESVPSSPPVVAKIP
jgi:Abnormal spindle-like microcephaly-assoc'd, ASPM-SPD-2-Hydin